MNRAVSRRFSLARCELFGMEKAAVVQARVIARYFSPNYSGECVSDYFASGVGVIDLHGSRVICH